MPRIKQLVDVTITENESQNGKRTWSVTIDASAKHFLLSDELAKEGAVRDLETLLRAAIRESVAGYIFSGREFVKSAAKKEKAKKGAE